MYLESSNEINAQVYGEVVLAKAANLNQFRSLLVCTQTGQARRNLHVKVRTPSKQQRENRITQH